MKMLKKLLQRPIFCFLILISLLELLPVSGKEAAALRLYETRDFRGEHTTYYALQPDGNLISWGSGPLDGNALKSYRNTYPYFLRKTIANDVISFACTSNTILYVDKDNVLRGSGMDEGLLRSTNHRYVWIMKDVEHVVANGYRAFALKTDGSLWTWLSNNSIKVSRNKGIDEENVPKKIGENIHSIFLTNNNFFAITNEHTLTHWDVYGSGELETVAPNAEAVSSLYLKGKEIYQYLDRQGKVYTIKQTPAMKATEKPIADNVVSLCEEGFIRKDHSLWTWQGSSENGMPVKTHSGVRAAANQNFYVDTFGRLHWRTSTWRIQVPSQSVRWLNPDSRKTEALVLCLFLLLFVLYKLFG